MKKLVFLFVAFAAVSFASCGNKAANNSDATDAVETVKEAAAVVEEVVDSVAACSDSAKACCDSAKAE